AFTLEAARRDSGAADVPEGNAHLLVELDGQPETVLIEMEKLRALVSEGKTVSLRVATTEEDCERFWALRRAFSNSLRGIGLAKKRWWPQATSDVSREIHRAIKDALDPAGILNPGKFL